MRMGAWRFVGLSLWSNARFYRDWDEGAKAGECHIAYTAHGMALVVLKTT